MNNSEESTQLAFQLKHDIDSFEIDIPKRKTIRFLVSKSRTIDTMDIAENSFFQEDENVDEKIENYESNNLSIDNKLFIAIGFLISAADITNSSSFLAGTIISLLSIIL